MTLESNHSSDRNVRLEQILAEYLRAVEAGEPLDQEAFIDRHPDLLDELRSFFANRAELERIAAPLKDVASEPTIGLATARDVDKTTLVRYFGDYELLEELGRGGMAGTGKLFNPRILKLSSWTSSAAKFGIA